jgi:phosphoribosylformylglycinamidine synthase
LARIEGEGQVAFRYAGLDTDIDPKWCPNGSINNIAGVYNDAGNVLGLMPHPEDATEKLVGGLGGAPLFSGIAASIGAGVAA